MELKWTRQALSDLARLYDFLPTVNQQAAAGGSTHRTGTDYSTHNPIE